MTFYFDSRKAAQAACRIMHRHPGELTFGEVVKLLYFADRESLIRTGHPITGDRMVSMDHGAVLSRTYNLVKEEDPDPEASEIWRTYVSPRREGFICALKTGDDPDVYSSLSDWEIAIIDDVTEKLGDAGFGGLRNRGHALPEWHDPLGSSETIDPTVILQSAGWSEAEIAGAEEDARGANAFALIVS